MPVVNVVFGHPPMSTEERHRQIAASAAAFIRGTVASANAATEAAWYDCAGAFAGGPGLATAVTLGRATAALVLTRASGAALVGLARIAARTGG